MNLDQVRLQTLLNNLPIISNYDSAKIVLDILRSEYDYYKLDLAIMNDDEQTVRGVLSRIDPRDDNYYAYQSAIDKGNQKYVNIIANDIARRNWYERQVYKSGFRPLVGKHEPSREIQSYTRRL